MKYATLILLSASLSLPAQDTELAKKLANPVADLISVPVQSNYDFGIGPGDGSRWTTNIQPVIPFALDEHWNLISRTIIPIVHQEGVLPAGAADADGLGDILQSLFFSPRSSDPIWGVGPAMLLPTASDDLLGTGRWCLGPTAVVLKQDGRWTYGALANHLWDIAGDGDRASVNATFIQPFLSHTLPSATTFTLNLESTYDWQHDQWTVPVNAIISQLLRIGDQPLQLSAGIRYYAESPAGGPEWGLRLALTFLFPK
jgi:hypothetical protein